MGPMAMCGGRFDTGAESDVYECLVSVCHHPCCVMLGVCMDKHKEDVIVAMTVCDRLVEEWPWLHLI